MIFRHKVVEKKCFKGKNSDNQPAGGAKNGGFEHKCQKGIPPPGWGGCLRNLTEWDLGTRKFYGMKPYGYWLSKNQLANVNCNHQQIDINWTKKSQLP